LPNSSKKPILTTNPKNEEMLKDRKWLKNDLLFLIAIRLLHIQKYENKKFEKTANSKEIVGAMMYAPT
jgi:hypothetical protein